MLSSWVEHAALMHMLPGTTVDQSGRRKNRLQRILVRSLRLVFCKKTDCEMSDSHIDPPMLILFSSDNIFSKTEVRSKAGTQARRQASKQAIKQASKQLCKQASERASSRQTCKQASRQSSKHQAAARNSQQQPSKAEPSEAKQTAKQSMPVMSLPAFSSLDNAR